jgi:hypothetical protein
MIFLLKNDMHYIKSLFVNINNPIKTFLAKKSYIFNSNYFEIRKNLNSSKFAEVVNRIEFKSKVNRIRLKIESNLNLN